MSEKSFRALKLGLTTLCLLTSCAKDGPSNTLSTKAITEYNQVVEKYNALLNSSHPLQTHAESELLSLEALDRSFQELAASAAAVENSARSLPATTSISAERSLETGLAEFSVRKSQALRQIADLETKMLALYTKLLANSDNVYLHKEVNKALLEGRKKNLEALQNTLSGIRAVVGSVEQLTYAYTDNQVTAYEAVTGKTARASLKNLKRSTIIPSQRDSEVATTVKPGDAGFYRTADGRLVRASDANELVREATRHGISGTAVAHGYEISRQTGGTISFAVSNDALPTAISDALSHFKQTLNPNAGALEIAFVVDYSGSMSDDIAAVIKGLHAIVAELANVKHAGLEVRIGIVTFGNPGQEKVEQTLSADLTQTAKTLDRLLSEYATKNHSTNPGEASYHGMYLAATQLAWTSPNRMSIVLTDEESFEVATQDNAYISATLKALSHQAIHNRIYTLLVP